ncbi:MAG TPA: DoxX family protein [Bryobacteraceae bacterium]|nr:DoxX family protein [Bryobacteraceae bacterium]
MQAATALAPAPGKRLWAGRIVSAVPALFLVLDAAMHIAKPDPVVQAFTQLGFPLNLAVPLGVTELLLVALFVVPRTSLLGAILLTGYLGGAVASHVRVGDPTFQTIFPILVGALLWGGLFLRDARFGDLVTH